ncbi:MAG: hypothetical protein ABGY24_03630, partial [bacterium]
GTGRMSLHAWVSQPFGTIRFVVLFSPPDSLREVAYLGNSHAALKFDAFIQNSGGWYTSSVNVREMGK